MFDFAAELAKSGKNAKPEPVAVITARAREFKFAGLELDENDKVVKGFKTCAKKRALEWGIDCSRVMYGSAHEWLFQDFKAWRKFANFELLAESLGDIDRSDDDSRGRREYVFVGDTGEMDREAGELVLSRHPQLVRTVFLHCVSPSETGDDCFVPVDYAVGAHGRVYHFRTYVGAALKAVKAGILDLDAFDRVVAAAFRDLDDRGVTDDNDPNNQRRDLHDDLDKALKYFHRCGINHQTNDLTTNPRGWFGVPMIFLPAKTPSPPELDDDWCPNRNYRDELPWWERPVLSRFLSVGSPKRSTWIRRSWDTVKHYPPLGTIRRRLVRRRPPDYCI